MGSCIIQLSIDIMPNCWHGSMGWTMPTLERGGLTSGHTALYSDIHTNGGYYDLTLVAMYMYSR